MTLLLYSYVCDRCTPPTSAIPQPRITVPTYGRSSDWSLVRTELELWVNEFGLRSPFDPQYLMWDATNRNFVHRGFPDDPVLVFEFANWVPGFGHYYVTYWHPRYQSWGGNNGYTTDIAMREALERLGENYPQAINAHLFFADPSTYNLQSQVICCQL